MVSVWKGSMLQEVKINARFQKMTRSPTCPTLQLVPPSKRGLAACADLTNVGSGSFEFGRARQALHGSRKCELLFCDLAQET